MSGIFAGLLAGGGASGDASWSYVSMLLSTTSLSNANNNLFADSSGAFNPISRTGNTTQGSFTPYGSLWSNYFDGSGDYLTAPDNTALQLGSSDFTIEFWVNFSVVPGAAQGATLVSKFNTSNTGYEVILYNNTMYFQAQTANIAMTYAFTPTAGTWYHIAWTRSGANSYGFINGALVASTSSASGSITNLAQALQIGRRGDNTFYLTGYMSNVRIVKGTAVYTAAFTPPTTPLTAITNTSLLTCQSNGFRDASTNNFTISAFGNTSVQKFSPFSSASPGISYNQSDITNWSGYFDGTGDYLTVPDDNALDFGTGDFTIEMWINAQNLSSVPMFFHKGTSVSTGWFFQTSGSTLYFGQLDSNRYSTWSVSLANNAWYHIALTRVGAVLNVFVNGVSQGAQTVTSANLSNDNTGLLYIGEYINGTYYYQGYLSNYRIVKGSAVYTSNFTVPTSNLTAISGTSLLTLQNAAFTDNSTNNFVVTINGNTTVTGNSPFNPVGYWSGYFDGTNAYLTSATSSAYAMGTGDFTIEGWFFTTASGDQALWDNRASTSSAVGIACRLITSTNTLRVILNNTALFTTSQAVTLNQWNHIAIVRASGTVTAYLNGTAMTGGSATGTTNITDTNMWIGKLQDAGFFYNGYISNFRVVKGTAVYTSTFTPPTTPLTAISGTSLLTCQNGRFIDNSTNAFAITVNGDVSVQSFDPFYTSTIASNGGSAYFDGTGDSLSVPSSPGLNFGTSNWTIECWVYVSTRTTNYPLVFGNNRGSFTTDALALTASNSDSGGAFLDKFTIAWGSSGWSSPSAGNSALLVANVANVTGTWYHLAIVRESSTSVKMYRNGVQVANATVSSGATFNWGFSGSLLGGGNWDGAQGAFNGYISNLRATPSAVYTAAFTPPTSVLTPTANTTLLVNGMNAGAYDATAINDMETVGNAQVRFPTPFAPANYWAGAFDGTGDYLTSPSNAAFALGTGDYTVECWIYATSTPSDQGIYEGRSTGSASDGFTLTAFSGSVIRIFSGGVLVASTGTSYVGQWTHVAVTRASGTTALWINGVSQGTSSTSYNCTNTDAVVGGGRYTSGTSINTSFPGLISNFRIVKGTAVYTSAFTPSTTPLTAIANTSLLTCQNKTFIDNSANAFTVTANGNATAGAVGPFTATGSTSTYFDGSGDYLQAPYNDAFQFGTGDFTVEFWINSAASGSYNQVVGTLVSGTENGTWRIGTRFNSLNNLYFARGNGSGFDEFNIAANANDGAWHHVACTRSSGLVRLFLDGTVVSSSTISGTCTSANPLRVGYNQRDNVFVNGYIDDLRITKGVARYTANFTAPTAAFPTF